MLRKFRVRNFQSFRDWQTLDLTVAGNAPELPGRFIRSIPGAKERFPTFVAIFGANASGKTNILRALNFVTGFVQFSQNDPPNEPIGVVPFLGTDSHKEPSAFEVEFDSPFGNSNHRIRFDYRLSIAPDGKQVLNEELGYYPNKRRRRLFSRDCQSFRFGADFGLRRNDPAVGKIRPNSSVVSTLAQFNHSPSIEIVEILSFVQSNFQILSENPERSMQNSATFYRAFPRVLKDFIRISRKFDIGIDEVEIVLTDSGPVPIFHHSGLTKPVHYYFESAGTSKIFTHFPILRGVLARGGLAVIDEFDNAIHSLLLPEIIDWFIDEESNPHRAQLIAVCQNPSILHHLEKEEIFLAEKSRDGASEIYGMKDVEGLRRNENLYANYLTGALGGIPRLA